LECPCTERFRTIGAVRRALDEALRTSPLKWPLARKPHIGVNQVE
jgi:hypothetical protein